MAKRSSKTAAQQCRYYEVDNIFVYMVETYINGNISVFRELYRVAIGVIVAILSTIAFFGFILWLFTL